MRYETPAPPAELGELDGLAYSLWLPDADPWAGVVVLHGARSCKESHHDLARAARSAGLSAVCFDQRGHGETGGELDTRALDDVATVADLLGDVPLALRGSSLEAFLAEHPLDAAVEQLHVPILLMHAEGDEQVPAAHSRELARRSPDPRTWGAGL